MYFGQHIPFNAPIIFRASIASMAYILGVSSIFGQEYNCCKSAVSLDVTRLDKFCLFIYVEYTGQSDR